MKPNRKATAALVLLLLLAAVFSGCGIRLTLPLRKSEKATAAPIETAPAQTTPEPKQEEEVPEEAHPLVMLNTAHPARAIQPRTFPKAPVFAWGLLQTVPDETVETASCSVMQGMCCDDRFAYTVKIPQDETFASFSRVDLNTGRHTFLPYYDSPEAKTPVPCNILGHANDMAAVKIGKETHLFVTVSDPTFSISLVRLLARENGLYFAGAYTLLHGNGLPFRISAVDCVRTENKKIYLLGKSSLIYYSIVIGEELPGSTPESPTELFCPRVFTLDIRSAQFPDKNATAYGIDNPETWVNQGSAFDSETDMLYVPIWKRASNENAILVYDAAAAVTVEKMESKKNLNTILFPCEISIRIKQTDLKFFEMESCDFRIAPGETGTRTLYFNNNATEKAEGVYMTFIESGMIPKSSVLSDDSVLYTVEYDANGGEGSMLTTRHISDIESTLRLSTFSSIFDAFIGWKLERKSDGTWLCSLADGTLKWLPVDALPEGAGYVLLMDGSSVSGLTTVPNDVIIAHAQWISLSGKENGTSP